jgi:hypothetical protein
MIHYNKAMVRKSTLALLTALATSWLLSDSDHASAVAGRPTPLPVKVVREYVEAEQRLNYQELLEEFGHNKELPEGFELQALLALSHYPELKNIRIRFVVDDVDIPLSSRPHWASMLRSAGKRTYLVVIDSERDGGRDDVLLKRQPFNAQTGIIGHELAHTVYYLDRSFFGILDDALCQLSDCRVNFERQTDRRTVDYGLGWQRFDHSVFLRRSRGVDPFAEPNPGSTYLGPPELLSLMEANPAYQSTLAQL